MVDASNYYDILIGDGATNNYYFAYAINDQQPYIRQTNDFKRQQIDTSAEPGEQTLSQWWVRAEDSFHRGAGILNYDPASNRETEYRYTYGLGVNPWTQGQITNALAATTVIAPWTGSSYLTCGTFSGTQYFFVNNNGTVARNIANGTGTQYTPQAAAAVGKIALAGTTVLVGSVGNAVMSGSATTPGALTNLWTGISGSVNVYWVKGRIIATGIQGGNGIAYELTLAGGAVPATPTWTCPIPGGVFADVVEAPDCILAAVNAGGRGYVYRVTLVESTTSGSSPTLGAWTQVAEMPQGEEINALQVYLGSFLAMGTSQGVRVCDLGQNGNLAYGPLTISGTACSSLAARDHFIFAGVNDPTTGLSTVARIDLGQEIYNFSTTGIGARSLRYAYNYDCPLGSTTTANPITSIAPLSASDGVVFTAKDKGLYVQQTDYNTAGTFTTGRIRYDTSEGKNYCYLRLSATVPSGTSIEVYALFPDGTQTLWALVTSSTNLGKDITAPSNVYSIPYTFISLKFVLNGTSSATPTIHSYTLKANPRPNLQRLVQLPLRCSDWEQDHQGTKWGYDGSAYARLAALEAFEAAYSLIQVTDKTSGETFTGIIQKIQFIRDTPPSRNATNFGGVLIVTVLKI